MNRKLITILLLSISYLCLPGYLAKAQSLVMVNQSHSVNEDGTIELIFDFRIEAGWYMYGVRKIDFGPSPTTVEFEASNNYELIGSLKEITKAKVKFDNGFNLEVDTFEGSAQMSQTIKPLTNKSFSISGTLSYQVCNNMDCNLEESDFSFLIPASSVATSVGSSADTPSENEEQGLLLFLLLAFAAGLGGVITPCVFPMIPMTVGFLINTQGNKRAGRVKGIIFGLSVTLIYTLLGVIVSIFQSTSTTDVIGTHWIPNLIFALMFLIFAISFFGAFEITLPSGLANKADQKADKGGYIAAFFVAVAMVIVSFSCTGPFVGSILAAAVSGGFALKPILGMAVFGIAFSLPFVLFSFFPDIMKKLPKSGDWLNMVKVVFAFVLLAFSFKFFYNIDAYFGWGFFTRLGFLSIWIVLVVMLGLYFLGKIRTHHDGETTSLGWGRLLAAMACFSFAIYLFTGLFGAPLASVSGLVPPPDGSTIVMGASSASSLSSDATSGEGLCGPAKYAGSHKAPHGLKSYYDIQQAIECSKSMNKPILLSFKSNTCSVCKVMEATVWNQPEVLDLLNNELIIVSLYIDDKTELPESEWITSVFDGKVKKTHGRVLREYQLAKFGISSQPYYAIIDENETILTKPMGSGTVEEFLSFLKSGIEKYKAQK